MRTIVIGAGMAGVAAAVRLRGAGYSDITVYEKGDRIGGTWRENTYPGIACDVPSHLYTYSFAPNPDWSHLFSPGSEIREYLERVAREAGIDRDIVFNTEVTRLERRGGRWHVTTSGGASDEADVVIAATGVLHHPRYPDIPGLDTFAGASFHSSRWDHSVAISGARVGVIGTGSSAVQIVGAIVDQVGELRLFQRTAQWIMPMANPPISDADREAYRREPESLRTLRDELAFRFFENFANAVVDADSPQMKFIEEMCRANLEDSVKDEQLRERLRPDYRAACKRLVVSSNFYDALQHPGAVLVTDPITAIEPAGVRTTDGVLHELDVLVLATGFRVDRFIRPVDVTGRDGVRLSDVWADRPTAFLSLSVPGFPNLFLLNGPNGPVGNFSLIEVAELQLDYVLQLMEVLRAGSATEISASREAAESLERERLEAAQRTIWVTGCRSWYLDDRGVPAVWPWSYQRFRDAMSTPDLNHYDLVRG